MSSKAEIAPRTEAQFSEAELQAWQSFLRSHAAITRQLDAELGHAHGLTVSELEVMLHLEHAPERRLRPSELADRLLLTRSRISRLVDGLEHDRLVRRDSCSSDARGFFVELTEAGRVKLHAAAPDARALVRALFSAPFSEEELATLASLLARLPGAGAGAPCPSANG